MEAYRVLIVDDQRDIRRLFAESIKTLGKKIEVLESPSGEEALMVAAFKPIDLLIADVNLPGISGLDLIRRIRKRKPELAIILVTGLTDPNLKLEIDKLSVGAVFFKPVEIQALLEEVKIGLGLDKPAKAPVEKDEQEAAFLTMREPASAEVMLLQKLSRLALEQGASSAAVLDESGKVLAQSGEYMQTASDPIMLGVVMAAYRASMEVTHALRRSVPENLLCFSGADFSLCLIPAGALHLVLLEGGVSFNRNIFGPGRAVLQAMPELQKLIGNLVEAQKPTEVIQPVEAEVEAPAKPEEILAEPNPEDLAKVDALFSQRTDKKLKTEDLDAFWNSVMDKGDTVSGDKNVLTYEQARKMGLTPD